MANTLAMQLYSLRNYEGGWDAAFDAVKSLGIDTIEAWCGAVPNDPAAETSVDSMRASLDRAGMKLTCGHMTVAEFDARYDEWKRFLLDYGSRDWVIPFAKAETLDEWLAMLPKWRAMGEVLAADGLSIGYHNHHMELVKHGEKYVMEHLLDNMPELRAQFHIGQFLPDRGIALPDWIHRYEGRVCSIHVNDADGGGPARVGKGDCRAVESIKAALDTGVTTFIVEVDLTQKSYDQVKADVETTRELIG